MFLKNKFIIILISIIMILSTSLFLIFKLYQNEKSERQRYNNNILSIIKNRSRQQELTINELKDLYPKYDSIAKELKIKTKYITNIIDTRYRFKDTLISKTILRIDSLSQKSFFNLSDKCYKLNGYVKGDSISITNKEFNDNITTFLYKDWEKKYLWGLFKFKPYYSVKVYSECLNDTISVNNNIKIK